LSFGNPSSPSGLSDCFGYEKDDNWIYIAFQTDLSDYTFVGALIYEYYSDIPPGGQYATQHTYRYTGDMASPVYDPDIVKAMTAS
jgi:hypothetical protein